MFGSKLNEKSEALITWAEAKLGALVDVITAAFAEATGVVMAARKPAPQPRIAFKLKHLMILTPLKELPIGPFQEHR